MTDATTLFTTHAEVIALFGNARLAARIGIGAKRVEGWKRRNSIPAPYFASIVAAAEAEGHDGVTFEALARASCEGVLRPATSPEETE